MFFTAGNPARFYKFARLARDVIGRELKLIDEARYEFAWIVDFPMFPMNQQAQDLLMGAPGEVTAKQLRELHLKPNLPNRAG